mmetsp:Transcript_2268/g.15087  ORF Transcript_2268/g.15087 Transcript_2268/m.15087 type:complete len:110 (+) Transcript_2268:1026-1355(+)
MHLTLQMKSAKENGPSKKPQKHGQRLLQIQHEPKCHVQKQDAKNSTVKPRSHHIRLEALGQTAEFQPELGKEYAQPEKRGQRNPDKDSGQNAVWDCLCRTFHMNDVRLL